MKPFVLILLLSTLGFAQSAPADNAPPSQSIPVDQENVRKAKALIDEMVQALGGQAYLTYKNVELQGRTYSFHHGEPNSIGTVFWLYSEYPDKERVELTKKRDVSYVYNGDKGYEITYKGTREADPKDSADYLRRREYSLDWVLRKWLKQPDIALFYEGQTVAAEKPAEQVTIMDKNDRAVTLFIDSSSHLPIKKRFTWRDPTDKQRNIEEEVWDNYRPVQGMMAPFSITRFYNGDMSNQRFLTSVKFNQPLDESIFQASVPAKTAEKH
jgi:hypothetical protein